jgi:hypothetical protein
MLLRCLAVLVLLPVLAPAARGESAREILDRRKALEAGPRRWNDRQYDMSLRITGRGAERTRQLTAYEKRYPGDERKTVVFFQDPADVKGTALLSVAKSSGPAAQWLYLPELKRVRQVTSRGRDESFVGSDLTYGDLDLIQEIVNWSENDAATNLRGEETVDGTPSWVIEFAPKGDEVHYKKIVVWLGKDDLVSRQIELYAEGDKPKKRARQSEIRNEGAIPVAHRVDVETVAAGTKTQMQLTGVKYDQGLDDELFTQRALERGKP